MAERDRRLEEQLAKQFAHLPSGAQSHFHVVLTTDNPNEWEFARFVASPPYRQRALAEQDATDKRLVRLANGFDIDVLECDRACPHSSLGVFGWDTDERASRPWWEGGRWPGSYS